MRMKRKLSIFSSSSSNWFFFPVPSCEAFVALSLPMKPYFEEKSFMIRPLRKKFILSLCWRKNVDKKKYIYHTMVLFNLRSKWYRSISSNCLILNVRTYWTYLHCCSYSTWFGHSLKSIYICLNQTLVIFIVLIFLIQFTYLSLC